MTPIVLAERVVGASQQTLFDYLADLEQHWQLADRFIQVTRLDRAPGDTRARGGVVEMRGPLGIRRTAHTRVDEASPPERLSGTAQVGTSTLARVTWTLTPVATSTRVRLEASVERASLSDRVVLRLGGRHWLERHFREILETLDRRVGAQRESE